MKQTKKRNRKRSKGKRRLNILVGSGLVVLAALALILPLVWSQGSNTQRPRTIQVEPISPSGPVAEESAPASTESPPPQSPPPISSSPKASEGSEQEEPKQDEPKGNQTPKGRQAEEVESGTVSTSKGPKPTKGGKQSMEGGRWTVLVGSFRKSANAERLQGELHANEWEARVVPVMVEGTRYYRVYVGRARNRERAERTADHLHQADFEETLVLKVRP